MSVIKIALAICLGYFYVSDRVFSKEYAYAKLIKTKKDPILKNRISSNQSGIAHLLMLVLFVAVAFSITFVGLRVSNHSSKPNLSSAAKAARERLTKSTATKITPTSTLTTVDTTAPSASSTTTGAPKTNTVVVTKFAANPTPEPKAATAPTVTPAPVIPQGYTNLGTISSATLYTAPSSYYNGNPPASNLQPAMTIYACFKSTGTYAGYMKAFALLAYGIPQSVSSNYTFGFHFSVSPTVDDPVTNKVLVYWYSMDSWLNNGVTNGNVNQSNTINSDSISGVSGDYFLWAGGDVYPGTGKGITHDIDNHPNVTQLATCI